MGEKMNETQTRYLGRIIDKKHFRAFIYATDGNKKLVESWTEFEKHISTGVWFDKKEKAQIVTLEPEAEEIIHEEVAMQTRKKRAPRKQKEVLAEIDTVTLVELLSLPVEDK